MTLTIDHNTWFDSISRSPCTACTPHVIFISALNWHKTYLRAIVTSELNGALETQRTRCTTLTRNISHNRWTCFRSTETTSRMIVEKFTISKHWNIHSEFNVRNWKRTRTLERGRKCFLLAISSKLFMRRGKKVYVCAMYGMCLLLVLKIPAFFASVYLYGKSVILTEFSTRLGETSIRQKLACLMVKRGNLRNIHEWEKKRCNFYFKGKQTFQMRWTSQMNWTNQNGSQNEKERGRERQKTKRISTGFFSVLFVEWW